jgi:SAM-dependent methyltransferase
MFRRPVTHADQPAWSAVDQLNASFYSRFPYPWRPMSLRRLLDPDFESRFLAQAVGRWGQVAVPSGGRIWVAGCGTNQAVITALRFPAADVLGTDLSEPALELARETARQVGAGNVTLRRESIAESGARETFDYVLCTGVLHHVAEPEGALRRLAEALRPAGVIELMVYNAHHRVGLVAFQDALRLLHGGPQSDFDGQLELGRALLANPELRPLVAELGQPPSNVAAEALADALIQPVERGYTMAELSELAGRCGLCIAAPCLNEFDLAYQRHDWNMRFVDPDVQGRYDGLPDVTRWQITNLLRRERSPMLWVYLQREDSPLPVKPESQLTGEFLAAAELERGQAPAQLYMRRGASEPFRPHPDLVTLPRAHPDPACQRIVDAVTGPDRVGLADAVAGGPGGAGPADLNLLRLHLTTPLYPYLLVR